MRPLEMNEPNDPIRKAVDAAAIAALTAICVSGIVLRTAESPFARSMGVPVNPLMPLLFGLRSAQWSTLHDRSSLLFLILLLPNLFWSRDVFRWVMRRGERPGSFSRAAIGVVALVSLGGWLLTGFHLHLPGGAVAPPQVVPLLGQESDSRLAALSLQEIQTQLGVPTEYMRVNLGLPPGVDTALPLGSLMKKYPFSSREVRRVLLMHRMNSRTPLPPASPVPRQHF